MNARRKNGFTLLEMVVTIATLSILAMLITPYLSLSARAYNDNAVESKILGQLRYASERIARELREMRRDPSAPANYDIATPLLSDRVTFFRNDGERVTVEDAAPLLNMSYFGLQGDTRYPLSSSLQSLVFNYWQSDEINAASGGNDLAYIEFEIQLLSNGNTYSQRSRVALRSMP